MYPSSVISAPNTCLDAVQQIMVWKSVERVILCVVIESGVTQDGRSGFFKTERKKDMSRLRSYFVSFGTSQLRP